MTASADAERVPAADLRTPLRVYKMDISYFSGKLEAYLRYKRIPYQAIEADERCLDLVAARTGTRKVPAVELPDGRWLFDTTPTMAWLEAQYPGRATVPPDPSLAFLAALLEDYADEWLWRPAMWWRWEPVASRRALGLRIASAVYRGPFPRGLVARFFAARQRHTWLWGDGVHSGNALAVRNLYFTELDFLQSVLQDQAYLLGNQPSLADFGYFGPMFRHFGNDPDPAEVMRRRAPAVYEWLARLWNAGYVTCEAQPLWRWPEGDAWGGLWRRIAGDYLPYLQQNALAFRARRRRFDFRGDSLSFPGTVTNHYRACCRQELQRRYAGLQPAERERVDAVFAGLGGLAALLGDGVIDAGAGDRYDLPRPPGEHPVPMPHRWFGQPRN